MTVSHHFSDELGGPAYRRPAWMPNPKLLAFIAALWLLAGGIEAVTLLK